jgi:hypothetical protein
MRSFIPANGNLPTTPSQGLGTDAALNGDAPASNPQLSVRDTLVESRMASSVAGSRPMGPSSPRFEGRVRSEVGSEEGQS